MSAADRTISMQEAFVTDAGPPLLVQVAGSDTPVIAVQLGGGTLSVDDKVYCFPLPSGNRSVLGALKAN